MGQTTEKAILLVEDEAIIALHEKATLEKYGYTVETVYSGEKAVNAVDGNPEIDLVLMDIDLGPGMPGDEAAERILKIRHLPIVFLTSHTEREYVDRVKEITRYGYVIKNSGEFVLWDSIEVAFELFEANKRNEQKNEELRAANEELEHFFSVNLDLLSISDIEGRFLKVNNAWQDTLGYRAEDLEQRKFLDFIHPEDLDDTLEALERLNHQEEVIDFVNRYRGADGNYRFIEWRSRPRGNRIYTAARDISARVESEHAIRQSETHFRRLVENAPYGIFVQTNWKLTYLNSAAVQLFGAQRPEELIDTPVLDRFHHDYRSIVRDRIRTLNEERTAVPQIEEVCLKMDGTPVPVEVSAAPLEYAGADGALVFVRDITREKRLE